VRVLEQTDRGLRTSLGAWRVVDPKLRQTYPPKDVHLWALRQQRALIALRDSRLRPRVLARLHGALARGTRQTLTAMIDLRRLSPAHPPKRRFKVGKALPAGRLLTLYRGAQKRFGVAWNVLAAVNFVETGFNKLRNDSISGAQGPMQFMPATWRAYGLGGDVHDPHDAILGAANYLHASGAPGNYGRALYSYNPSSLYVDAVLRYARRIRTSGNAFLSYYSWQVFVREPSGRLRRLTGPR
jgi:membrane-bound lytic murein transglycosylase B